MKTADQLRKEFITFFESKSHHNVRSSAVVPHDDATLLFANAGMNQFKDCFLGTGTRDYNKAVNFQKCIRASGKHNDLEDVGLDTFHHTFFEMLGNWSFGDYFKEDAILWAWELLTEVWKLPKDKLWATVFEGSETENIEPDMEAENIWKNKTDIDQNKILRCSKKDNFWEMGETGPCGPCTEIHMDMGEGKCTKDHKCEVNVEGCARFIELWNLVFIQYNRKQDQTLEALPAKHVDTGMGLERILSVLQNVDSNYKTDLFTPIFASIEDLSPVDYEPKKHLVPYRVISDHLRSLSFAIADGAIPSNEGRGYVLRRMLRRAARFGREVGFNGPFLSELVPALATVMQTAYPELNDQLNHIKKVILAEEESFDQTLGRGLEIFKTFTNNLKKGGQLNGESVFKLYDTYGFPVDLTELMCAEKGLSIDKRAFKTLMNEQRNRAREAGKFEAQEQTWVQLEQDVKSQFFGYDSSECEASVIKYSQVLDNEFNIVLDKTPFYAESGGQVADTGTLEQNGNVYQVVDVQKQGDFIIHFTTGDHAPQKGSLKARIDRDNRSQIESNHTATHLLQAALKNVLGEHIQQAGSVVEAKRLRFDFRHFEKINSTQIEKIESMVNEQIRNNTTLNIYKTGYNEAISDGVTALFSEKYADEVRVVKVDQYSAELCGGAHVNATGQIGLFKIVSEGAIASGIRRIEAISSIEAEKLAREQQTQIATLKQMLNTQNLSIVASVQKLLNDKVELEKKVRALNKNQASENASNLVENFTEICGIPTVISKVEIQSIDELKAMCDTINNDIENGIGVLGATLKNKANFIAVVNKTLVKKGIKAPDIVNLVATIAEGRGGGKPHLALAGAKNVAKIDQAIAQAPKLIEEYLNSKLNN